MQKQSLSDNHVHRLFLLTVTLLSLFLIAQVSSMKTVKEYPSSNNISVNPQLTVLAGTSTNITCFLTIKPSTSNNHLHKSNEVLWRWKPQETEKWVTVKNANATSIGSKEQNETNADEGILISVLRLSTVSVNMTGVYGCFFKDIVEPLYQAQLSVGYPPVPPTDLNCETNGYLSVMTCSFNPGRPTHLHTTYRVFYKISQPDLSNPNQNESKRGTANCSLDQLNDSSIAMCRCEIELPGKKNSYKETYLKFEMDFGASNALGSNSSTPFISIPNRVVKLDPPTDLRFINNGSKGSHSSLSVTWKAPEANTLLQFSYVVRYKLSEEDDDNWKKEDVPDTVCVLTHLDSDATYDVQVAAKLRDGGYFSGESEWSEMKSNKTSQSVPSLPFTFLAINATLTPALVDNETWNINIEWQLYKSDESGFYYNICYSVSNKNHTLPKFKYEINTATFSVNGSGDLTIFGKFCNDVGCSPFVQEVIDLDTALPPVQNVSLRLHSNGLNVTWKLPKHHILEDEYCIIRVCSSARHSQRFSSAFELNEETNALNHNIRSTLQHYNNDFCGHDPNQEVEVLCDTGVRFISRDDLSPCLQYSVVVLKLAKNSRNIKIMTASSSSLTSMYNPADPITASFTAKDASKQDSYEIYTNWEWTESLCRNVHNDLSLSVLYSPVTGAECTEDKLCPRKSSYFSPVSNCTRNITSYRITSDVFGATTYKLELGYCCQSSESLYTPCFAAYSTVASVTTPVGVPGKPLDLQWDSNDKARATWKAPEHPNGKIDGYIIQYGKVTSTTNQMNGTKYEFSKSPKNASTSNTFFEIPLACPLAEQGALYKIQVWAFNKVHFKNLIGPSEVYQGDPCASTSLPESVSSGWNDGITSMIIGITIILISVIIFVFLLTMCRKRIKQTVRKRIWPRVPEPNILIINGVQEKDFQDLDTYHNPLYRKERQDEDISCYETPDIFYKQKDVQQSNLTKIQSKDTEKFNHIFTEGVSNDDEKDCKGRQADASKFFPVGTDMKDRFLSDGETDHNPYSVITPLRPLLSDRSGDDDFDEYATTVSVAQFTSWRAILYPKSMKSQHPNSCRTQRLNRPHSYAGSSGSRFTETNGYVRYCEQNEQHHQTVENNHPRKLSSPVNKKSPTEITYSKLAVNYGGRPTFVEISEPPKESYDDPLFNLRVRLPDDDPVLRNRCRLNGDSRGFRGESWYDGYSSYKTTQLTNDQELNKHKNTELATSTSSLVDYVAPVESYVACSNSTDQLHSDKAAIDYTNNDIFDNIFDNVMSMSLNSGNVEADNTNIKNPDTPFSKDYAQVKVESSDDNDNRKRIKPLADETKETAPDYLFTRQNYVSLDDALQLDNERLSSSSQDKSNIVNSNDLDSGVNMSTFDFNHGDDWDDDVSLDVNDMAQFFDSPPRSSVANNEVIEDDYITTAEAAVRN